MRGFSYRTAPAVFAVISIVFSNLAGAQPAPPAPPAPAPVALVDDTAWAAFAKDHYARGKELFHEALHTNAWSRAREEFTLSLKARWSEEAKVREIQCFRKLKQYDEAHDGYDELRRRARLTYPDLEKGIAEDEKEMGTLTFTGDLLPGASITIGNRLRGHLPLTKPLWVNAGDTIVLVEKKPFDPISMHVTVQAGEGEEVKLQATSKKGLITINEKHGWALDLWVDKKYEGKTPWTGLLEAGERHVELYDTVSLAAECVDCAPSNGGSNGHEERALKGIRATVHVPLYEAITQDLCADDRDASLRVEATASDPHDPRVTTALDAWVTIDHGPAQKTPWEGRLDLGSEHDINITADGFLPAQQTVSLERRKQKVLRVALERDMTLPRFRKPGPVTLELGLPFSPSFGGGIAGNCGSGCGEGVALGEMATLKMGYELPRSGSVGVALDYLGMSRSSTGRATSLQAVGFSLPDPAIASDAVSLHGVAVGLWGGYVVGRTVPFRLRLGAGGFVGEVTDRRGGTFVPQSSHGGAQSFGDIATSSSAAWFYLAPEVRVGWKLDAHLELSAGVEALVMFAASPPVWNSATPVNAAGDGYATFAADAITGHVPFVVTPNLMFRYQF